MTVSMNLSGKLVTSIFFTFMSEKMFLSSYDTSTYNGFYVLGWIIIIVISSVIFGNGTFETFGNQFLIDA